MQTAKASELDPILSDEVKLSLNIMSFIKPSLLYASDMAGLVPAFYDMANTPDEYWTEVTDDFWAAPVVLPGNRFVGFFVRVAESTPGDGVEVAFAPALGLPIDVTADFAKSWIRDLREWVREASTS